MLQVFPVFFLASLFIENVYAICKLRWKLATSDLKSEVSLYFGTESDFPQVCEVLLIFHQAGKNILGNGCGEMRREERKIIYFNEQLQHITWQSNVPRILFVQKMQQIRFNKTLPLELCLLQPVWFNTETYNICCFTCVGGYSFLPSLYLPWQCRKGNNAIQTHRLQQHIQRRNWLEKALESMQHILEQPLTLGRKQGVGEKARTAITWGTKEHVRKQEYKVGLEWKQDPANQNTVATQPWIIPRALQSCTLDDQALLKETAEMDM